ncbi:hypothetical protein Bbelb_046780 [Branchiostoma belcheri]|nr:hypothetical protein Bbelb_046780 [Branchiostoma belcheri]
MWQREKAGSQTVEQVSDVTGPSVQALGDSQSDKRSSGLARLLQLSVVTESPLAGAAHLQRGTEKKRAFLRLLIKLRGDVLIYRRHGFSALHVTWSIARSGRTEATETMGA